MLTGRAAAAAAGGGDVSGGSLQLGLVCLAERRFKLGPGKSGSCPAHISQQGHRLFVERG